MFSDTRAQILTVHPVSFFAGMWYEAAELIWASITGYLTLPQPDKKVICLVFIFSFSVLAFGKLLPYGTIEFIIYQFYWLYFC